MFLIEKCTVYFLFIPAFLSEIDSLSVIDESKLFSCLEMTLSNPIHFNESENFFLCYGNNMVPLIFEDIRFYNIHSSQKWINFHEISRQLFCAFSGWERFLMIYGPNCKRDNALTSL